MPELPEVETVARQLQRAVTDHLIVRFEVTDSLLLGSTGNTKFSPELTHDQRIAKIFRVGKKVIFALEGERAYWLAIHLRMTGRLLVRGNNPLPPSQTAHLRARIHLRHFSTGEHATLDFVDTRRFGTIELSATLPELAPKGIDPIDDLHSRPFTVSCLAGLLKNSRQQMKAWLLRQDKLCGLGNIYVSEILFHSNIHPERSAGSVTLGECEILHTAILSVLNRAIENCGTTFSDFQQADGHIGGYQQYLCVYGKTGQPCVQCKTPIVGKVQQQRSTFYCPSCQEIDKTSRKRDQMIMPNMV